MSGASSASPAAERPLAAAAPSSSSSSLSSSSSSSLSATTREAAAGAGAGADAADADAGAGANADADASDARAAAVASAFALPPPPATLLDSVLQSIVTPGAGPGLVAAVNGSLLLFVAATAWIAWQLDDAFARRELLPLLGVGAALALCLLAAFNTFLALGGAVVPPGPAAAADDKREAGAAADDKREAGAGEGGRGKVKAS